MKKLAAALFTCLAVAGCGPFGDQRWEGSADGCTSGVDSFRVILLLDGPVVSPRVSGQLGEMYSGDDVVVADFDDGQWTPNSLKVDVDFKSGSSRVTWELDLESGPSGGYEGELTIDTNSGNGTVRCDVELSLQ